MTRFPGRKLSRSEVKEWLQKSNHVDQALSSRLLMPVHVSSDGQALARPSRGAGVLFALEELRQMLAESDERERARRAGERHGWSDLFDHPDEVIARVPRATEDLSRILEQDCSFVRSIDDLTRLDARLHKVASRKLLSKDVFVPLVALVGELVRKEVDGQWRSEIRNGEPELSIIDGRGQRLQIMRLYKELMEYPRVFSTAAFARSLAAR